jgi:hypothetical protein
MIGQQAVRLIDRLLAQAQQPQLNDLQSTIVLETWEGNTYRSIADRLLYDLDYIKQIAARLWKLLSKLLGEDICKNNIKSVLERCQVSIPILPDWREPMPVLSGLADDVSNDNRTETDLQSIATWMISDRVTTIAFFSSAATTKTSPSIKLDFQQDRLHHIKIQAKIQSLISQSLDDPVIQNSLVNEILSVLMVQNSAENSINCLIINCYN